MSTCQDEWTRLLDEVEDLPDAGWVWQPAPQQHSIGWHVRHLAEWRYVIVHGIISELPLREKLYCLGWEKDPDVKKFASNPGLWFEPNYKRDEQLAFLDKMRQTTNGDMVAIPTGRYREEMNFPGGRRRIYDQLMLEGLQHASLHRGQIRELRKAWSRQDWAASAFRSGWITR